MWIRRLIGVGLLAASLACDGTPDAQPMPAPPRPEPANAPARSDAPSPVDAQPDLRSAVPSAAAPAALPSSLHGALPARPGSTPPPDWPPEPLLPEPPPTVALDAGDMAVELPGRLGPEAPQAQIRRDGEGISFRVLAVRWVNAGGTVLGELGDVARAEQRQPAPGVVEFPQVAPDMDLRYLLRADALVQQLVIASPPQAPEPPGDTAVYLELLEEIHIDGALMLLDGTVPRPLPARFETTWPITLARRRNGVYMPLMSLDYPEVFDAAGLRQGADAGAHYALSVDAGGRGQLATRMRADFFAAPNLRYPLILDPHANPGMPPPRIWTLRVVPATPGNLTGVVMLVASNLFNTPLSITLDWGDGTVETLETAGALFRTHTYAEPGHYATRIFACDDLDPPRCDETRTPQILRAGAPASTDVRCDHLDEACRVGAFPAGALSCELRPRPDGTPCEDDDPATPTGSCSAGGCVTEEICCGVGDQRVRSTAGECAQAGGERRPADECPAPVLECTSNSDCVDGNTCTDGDCVAGRCVFVDADGRGCNDGDLCTISDTCAAGFCAGSDNPDCDGAACCLLFGAGQNLSIADCNSVGGTVSPGNAACDEAGFCCQRGGDFTLFGERQGCQDAGGAIRSAADCAGVCCDAGDSPVVEKRGQCLDDGGTVLADFAECGDEVCCGGFFGGVTLEPDIAACESLFNVRPDADCEEVCCEVAGEGTLQLRANCALVGGSEQPREVCEPPAVCCELHGFATQAASAQACQDLGGTPRDASVCGVVCCDTAGQRAFVTADECQTGGGFPAPDPAACNGPVCCDTGGGIQRVADAPTCVGLGAVVSDHLCSSTCCDFGLSAELGLVADCLVRGGQPASIERCVEAACDDGLDNEPDGLADCLDPDCTGQPCDDGDACTPESFCDGGACRPTPGLVVTCLADDGNPCTEDLGACDPIFGCHRPLDGNDCSDETACITGTCEQGACQALPFDCADGECQRRECQPGQGCVDVAPFDDGTACNDGVACNGNSDVCRQGSCTGTVVQPCPGDNQCRTFLCNAVSDCTLSLDRTGFPCGGSPCLSEGVCGSDGACEGEQPITCDGSSDGNLCTEDLDICDPDFGCHRPLDGTDCSNESECIAGSCESGTCVGEVFPCEDGACQRRECQTGQGCVDVAPLDDGTECDDGKSCNGNADVCQQGSCTGTEVQPCSNNTECQIFLCNAVSDCTLSLDRTGFPCGGGTCLTQGVCGSGGQCEGEQPITCDGNSDGNPCTVALSACDADFGCQRPLDDNSPCDDPSTCETGVCGAGACIGLGPLECPSVPCHTNTCTPGQGCIATPRQDFPPCDDGLSCNGADFCDTSGDCVNNNAVRCPGDTECVRFQCGGSSDCELPEILVGADCDDFGTCATGGTCNAFGDCEDGQPLTCAGLDDGNPCTRALLICDTRFGCQEPLPDGTPCEIPQACIVNAQCQAGFCEGGEICEGPCLTGTCLGASGCEVLGIASCDDGNACTEADTCNLEGECAGRPVDCEDGDPCTAIGCAADTGCFSTPIPGCDAAQLSASCPGAAAITQRRGSVSGVMSATAGDDFDQGACPNVYDFIGGPLFTGPDLFINLQAFEGDRLVTTLESQGFIPWVQVFYDCGVGEEQCIASSSGDFFVPLSDPSFYPYEEVIAQALSVAVQAPSTGGPAPLGAPGDPGAVEIPLRLVVNSADIGPANRTPPTGPITLHWRLISEAPPNDTAAGAAELQLGETLHNESEAQATDTFSASDCAGVADGAGSGTPELFYRFTAETTGHVQSQIRLQNSFDTGGSFAAVLDANGRCIASGSDLEAQRLLIDVNAGESYTLVFDTGGLTDVVFSVGVSAFTGLTNVGCDRAARIDALPFSQSGDLTGGFDRIVNDFGTCRQFLAGTPFAGGADAVWHYTPPEDQFVEFSVTAQSPDFFPKVLVREACVESPQPFTCDNAAGVSEDGSPGRMGLQLTAGTRYAIVVEGGDRSAGQFRLDVAEAANTAPDDCARAAVLVAGDDPRRIFGANLSDLFAGAQACSSDNSVVGENLSDAVVQVTATEAGVYTAALSGTFNGSRIYALGTQCSEGLQSSCDGITQTRSKAHLNLAAGETGFFVMDGWQPSRPFDHVEVEVTHRSFDANVDCDNAVPVSLPFAESNLLPFAGNDIQNNGGSCGNVNNGNTLGEDRAYRVTPGAAALDFAAGLLAPDFSWALYGLVGCGAGAGGSCIAGQRIAGSSAPKHFVARGVSEPVTVVVDTLFGETPGSYQLVMAELGTPPAHDTCESARVIDQLPFSEVTHTFDATLDYTAPSGTCTAFADSGFGGDVVYRLDITQAMKDELFRIEAVARDATHRAAVVVLKNGCAPMADHCISPAFSQATLFMSELEVGDQLFFVFTGREAGAQGFFEAVVEGQ